MMLRRTYQFSPNFNVPMRGSGWTIGNVADFVVHGLELAGLHFGARVHHQRVACLQHVLEFLLVRRLRLEGALVRQQPIGRENVVTVGRTVYRSHALENDPLRLFDRVCGSADLPLRPASL